VLLPITTQTVAFARGFLEHRIGDKRIIRLIRKWLKAGSRIIMRATLDGLIEDCRVRCEPCQRQIVDVAPQSATGQ